MFKVSCSIISMLILILVAAAPLSAQWSVSDSSRRTILQQPLGTTTPGEYPFTPEQDRRFYQALGESITGVVRFRYDAKLQSLNRIDENLFGTTDKSAAWRNMNLHTPYYFFKPNSRENIAFVNDRLMSFNVAGNGSARNVQGIDYTEEEAGRKLREFFGIKENISANVVNSGYKILEMLGLRENVDTTLEYKLEEPSLVDVWILSVECDTVQHLLSARQPKGTHTVTWMGRNDENIKMPRGYYVGQVFANKQKVFQKGIRW